MSLFNLLKFFKWKKVPLWRWVSPFRTSKPFDYRSRWPRGLSLGSAATRLRRLCVRVPPGAWMSVSCEYSVLSGRCLCDEVITRAENSYRMWCVVVCDLETSWIRRPWPTRCCCAQKMTNFHDALYGCYVIGGQSMSVSNFSAIFKNMAPTRTCEATVTLVPRNLEVQKCCVVIERWRVRNFVRTVFLSNLKQLAAMRRISLRFGSMWRINFAAQIGA
jgi:hypothetical protein